MLSITRQEQKTVRKAIECALSNLYFHITKNQKGITFPKREDTFLIIQIFKLKYIRRELWIRTAFEANPQMYPFPIHDTIYTDIYLSVHAYVLF